MLLLPFCNPPVIEMNLPTCYLPPGNGPRWHFAGRVKFFHPVDRINKNRMRRDYTANERVRVVAAIQPWPLRTCHGGREQKRRDDFLPENYHESIANRAGIFNLQPAPGDMGGRGENAGC